MMCTSIYHSSDAAQSSVTIFRDSTNLGRDDRGIIQFSDFEDRFQANATMTLLDSPNTTSSVTYKLYFRNINTSFWHFNSCFVLKTTERLVFMFSLL